MKLTHRRQKPPDTPTHHQSKPGHRAGLFAFMEVEMADYYTPTVVQETIPNADITALEQLLLSHVFEAVPDGGGVYFSSSEGPSDLIWVSRSELTQALAASHDKDSQVHSEIEKQLAAANPDDAGEIELDLAEASWEHMLQDIVRRSPTLRYITVTAAFMCSKMRADGFGGMALFITADAVKGFSTTEFIADCLAEIASGRESE
ncbi:hypothetical protein [Acidocella sp.]|uniref:hypothetical protein n=1 Tax=Acidocella sp. TaxID=50710 RepID=UPI003D0712FD